MRFVLFAQVVATTTDRLVGVDLRCSRARCLFDWRVEGGTNWGSVTGSVGGGSGEAGVGANVDMDDFGGSSTGLGAAGQSQRLSAFGSTACKSLYRCISCREPFEYFKPL